MPYCQGCTCVNCLSETLENERVQTQEKFKDERRTIEKLCSAVDHLLWLVEIQFKKDGGHITEDAKKLLANVKEMGYI